MKRGNVLKHTEVNTVWLLNINSRLRASKIFLQIFTLQFHARHTLYWVMASSHCIALHCTPTPLLPLQDLHVGPQLLCLRGYVPNVYCSMYLNTMQMYVSAHMCAYKKTQIFTTVKVHWFHYTLITKRVQHQFLNSSLASGHQPPDGEWNISWKVGTASTYVTVKQ
jgi:hypothetical protein